MVAWISMHKTFRPFRAPNNYFPRLRQFLSSEDLSNREQISSANGVFYETTLNLCMNKSQIYSNFSKDQLKKAQNTMNTWASL